MTRMAQKKARAGGPPFETGLNFRVGRVARALSLNFGCPVLRLLKGGAFVSA
jgi:hypothetical protein